jgi:hypothetical protein
MQKIEVARDLRFGEDVIQLASRQSTKARIAVTVRLPEWLAVSSANFCGSASIKTAR